MHRAITYYIYLHGVCGHSHLLQSRSHELAAYVCIARYRGPLFPQRSVLDSLSLEPKAGATCMFLLLFLLRSCTPATSSSPVSSPSSPFSSLLLLFSVLYSCRPFPCLLSNQPNPSHRQSPTMAPNGRTFLSPLFLRAPFYGSSVTCFELALSRLQAFKTNLL